MDKSERTRNLIVEKTAPLFNMKGYAGTSVSDMTEATGLTKGSVYGNFANKEEVALAAFGHNWARVRMALRTAMDQGNSSKEKLLAMMAVFEDPSAHGFPQGGCPLLNTAVEADDTHPGLRQAATRAFRGWQKDIVNVIGAGIISKEFRGDINAEQTALTLIALIEGATMISRLTGNARHRRSVLPFVHGIIIDLTGKP